MPGVLEQSICMLKTASNHFNHAVRMNSLALVNLHCCDIQISVCRSECRTDVAMSDDSGCVAGHVIGDACGPVRLAAIQSDMTQVQLKWKQVPSKVPELPNR